MARPHLTESQNQTLKELYDVRIQRNRLLNRLQKILNRGGRRRSRNSLMKTDCVIFDAPQEEKKMKGISLKRVAPRAVCELVSQKGKKIKKSTFVQIALLIMLSGCASYNPQKDQAYLDFLQYRQEMINAVERGEITQAEATTRIYQAQFVYNQRAEKKINEARAANANFWSNYLNEVDANEKDSYENQPQFVRMRNQNAQSSSETNKRMRMDCRPNGQSLDCQEY